MSGGHFPVRPNCCASNTVNKSLDSAGTASAFVYRSGRGEIRCGNDVIVCPVTIRSFPDRRDGTNGPLVRNNSWGVWCVGTAVFLCDSAASVGYVVVVVVVVVLVVVLGSIAVGL
jgi:hypothetical protein